MFKTFLQFAGMSAPITFEFEDRHKAKAFAGRQFYRVREVVRVITVEPDGKAALFLEKTPTGKCTERYAR